MFGLIVSPTVGVGPFRRMDIVDPNLLDPMHGAPPLAEQQVVEGGQR
jgi:hypothetical protein